MTIQLEVGKKYRRADGACVVIVSVVHTATTDLYGGDADDGDIGTFYVDGSAWRIGDRDLVAEWDDSPDSRVQCNLGEHSLVDTGGRHSWCRVCDLDFELVAWEWVPATRRNREGVG